MPHRLPKEQAAAIVAVGSVGPVEKVRGNAVDGLDSSFVKGEPVRRTILADDYSPVNHT